MAVRSILDIEINDEAFKRFHDLFSAYSDELEKQPEAWRRLNAAMGESGKELTEGALTAKDALAVAAAQAGLIAEALQGATKAQSDLGTATKNSAKGMSALAKAAGEVGAAIEFVGGWILKLGAIAGVGGLLSGFGIGDLASAAFTRFKSAGQLGLSPGQLASYQINMQPFLDTDALAGAVGAQQDVRKAGALAALGINYAGALNMSPAQLTLQELLSAVKIYKGAPKGLQQLMPGLTQANLSTLGLNIGEVRNAAMPGGVAELMEDYRNYQADITALDLPRKEKEEWDQLKITLDRAGVTIQSALIDGLAPLVPQLTKLTTAFAGVITALLKGPAFKQFLGDATVGLGRLAKWLASKDAVQFEDNIEALALDFGKLASITVKLLGGTLPKPNLGGFGDWLKKVSDNSWGDPQDIAKTFQNIGYWAQGVTNPKKLASIAKTAAIIASTAIAAGVDPKLALATAQVETGINANANNPDATSGWDTGPFQLNSGGEGAGHTIAELLNTKTNTQIAMREFSVILKEMREHPQRALNTFSLWAQKGERLLGKSPLTHDQIMALYQSPGEAAALSQRPTYYYEYAMKINRAYKSLPVGTPAPRKRSVKSVPIALNVTNTTASRFAISANAATV